MSVAVFADTFHFLALLNSSDAAHVRAIEASCVAGREFVTTEFVLLELADALAHPRDRVEFSSCATQSSTTRVFTSSLQARSCSRAGYSSTVSDQTKNGHLPIASPLS